MISWHILDKKDTLKHEYEITTRRLYKFQCHLSYFQHWNIVETSFELTNTSDKPMQWIVSSFAPPYVKVNIY